MGPRVRGDDSLQPHTCRAVSTTSSSLRFWSSALIRLPITSEAKPHRELIKRQYLRSFINAALECVDRLALRHFGADEAEAWNCAPRAQ